MTRKLVGVYNANGGLMGELSYIAGKVSGSTHCALCDITHGLNPLGKKEWKEAMQCFPVPIEMVHLNEMDERTSALVKGTTPPVIVLLSPEEDRILITTEEIEGCNKDPQALVDLILERLS